MKKRKKGQTPEEFIRNADSGQVECRVMRHAWNTNAGTVEIDGNDLIWRIPCMRDCGTKKIIRLKRTGELVRTHYNWRGNYHVTGGLRKAHIRKLRMTLLKGAMG